MRTSWLRSAAAGLSDTAALRQIRTLAAFSTACICQLQSYAVDMKSITIECPDQLHDQLESLVQAGWVKDQQEAMVEALRRFLDSHRPELQEMHILKDVAWGLSGH